MLRKVVNYKAIRLIMKKMLPNLFSYLFKQLKVTQNSTLKVANYQAYSKIFKENYLSKSEEVCIEMIIYFYEDPQKSLYLPQNRL
jgi:hypothetical protein